MNSHIEQKKDIVVMFKGMQPNHKLRLSIENYIIDNQHKTEKIKNSDVIVLRLWKKNGLFRAYPEELGYGFLYLVIDDYFVSDNDYASTVNNRRRRKRK